MARSVITQIADMDAAKSPISCLHLRAAGSGQKTLRDSHTHGCYLHMTLCHEQLLCGGRVGSFVLIVAAAFNSHYGPKECSVQLPSPQQEMEEVWL